MWVGGRPCELTSPQMCRDARRAATRATRGMGCGFVVIWRSNRRPVVAHKPGRGEGEVEGSVYLRSLQFGRHQPTQHALPFAGPARGQGDTVLMIVTRAWWRGDGWLQLAHRTRTRQTGVLFQPDRPFGQRGGRIQHPDPRTPRAVRLYEYDAPHQRDPT